MTHECPECGRVFDTKHALGVHRGHKHENPWDNEETLRELYVDKNMSLGEIADKLGCSIGTVQNALDKLGINRGIDIKCPACADCFDSERAMKIHHYRAHGGPVEENWSCSNCGKGYSARRGLIKHLTDECPSGGHRCDKCGRTFPTERGFSSHMSKVHDIQMHVEVECGQCGVVDVVEPWRARQSENYYCSNKCNGHATGPEAERITLECVVCGDDYPVEPYRAETSITCGEECRYKYMAEYMRGEDNPSYIDGGASYYGPNWKEQRQKRRERDEYTCQYCGEDLSNMGQEPDVHHLKRINWFKKNYDGPRWYEKGNRIGNLRTTCKECHGRWEGVPVSPLLLSE